ncbi:Coenzyme F420 hydrogenase/dehydrogenase, beta subunit C-terminal domain [Candidatus Bathyarchaeota archaeon]|nr:Coenzyme F420 hydrogenase/dehydrogenase, beta subunit C-terminal domain [Candidatus Bathyarchaeota archaeon]
MESRKLGFEESLGKDVVQANRCVGCATCVVVCPFKCLEYDSGQPKLVKECQDCGICSKACPKYDWSWPEVEEFVFGRAKKTSEDFGIYKRLLLTQANDKKILDRCQDGGFVTALLSYALENNVIEGAAISGIAEDRPFYPIPKLATTLEEVLEGAGTRYCYSPNILALHEGVKSGKKSLAFVGTPCQIHAIRKIEMFPLKKYSNPLRFTIGLMCTESFSYEGFFTEYLKLKLNLNLDEVEKMNIKGKIIISLKSGETTTVPLSEAKHYARENCHLCSDFSAELADISAGGLGLKGWTFVILRTEKGESIFRKALRDGALKVRRVDEEPFARNLLTKLSKKKLKNSSRD